MAAVGPKVTNRPSGTQRAFERSVACARSRAMNDSASHGEAAPAEWAAILAESEAEAGWFVSGDDIMRELRQSIARMQGRAATA